MQAFNGDFEEGVYNFNVFWQTFEEQYVFFDLYDVDWHARRQALRSQVDQNNLFSVMVEAFRFAWATSKEVLSVT